MYKNYLFVPEYRDQTCFSMLNICWAAREMLKPEPDRRGFQPLPRCPADVNVSENHV